MCRNARIRKRWEVKQTRRGNRYAKGGAIDLLDRALITGVEFARLDFLDAHAPHAIKSLLAGPAEVVLSDMAANAIDRRSA